MERVTRTVPDYGPTMEEFRRLAEALAKLPAEAVAETVARIEGYALGYRDGRQ